MLSPKSDAYLKEILSCVKFTFDRANIRKELESHISDKMEYYIEQGYDQENAEQLSIHDMGDAKEIGKELNKQHNPIIGWLWKITNAITVLIIIVFCLVFILFLDNFSQRNLIDKIPKTNILYKIDLKEKVKIDNRVICITNLIYEKNGDMNIFYETYCTGLRGLKWSLGSLGDITDNLGNHYTTNSGQQTSGLKSKGVDKVAHFSNKADMLIISYDSFNRKYKIEIPLKGGEKNE